MNLIRLVGIVLILGFLIDPAMCIDLTGTWESTRDDGTYYITQLGNKIVWYAEDTSIDPMWTQIAYGTIEDDTIELMIYDVPKGVGEDFLKKSYHSSKLILYVISKDKLATSKSSDSETRMSAGMDEDGGMTRMASGMGVSYIWMRTGSNPFNRG
jgi:hypothetical protein